MSKKKSESQQKKKQIKLTTSGWLTSSRDCLLNCSLSSEIMFCTPDLGWQVQSKSLCYYQGTMECLKTIPLKIIIN